MGGDGKNGAPNEKPQGQQGQQNVEERKVIITGSPEAQWKVSSDL